MIFLDNLAQYLAFMSGFAIIASIAGIYFNHRDKKDYDKALIVLFVAISYILTYFL